jgi:bacterial surface protein 26-residue repeat
MISKIKNSFNVLPKWVKGVSALFLVMALLVIGLAQSLGGSLAAPVGDVIFKYPQNPMAIPPSIQDVNWTHGVDHPGYDIAYTEAVSAQYNGTATPNHVVVQNNDVSFFGYAERPNTDVLFYEDNFKSRGNAFILTPSNMNFHTFEEAGYLFNGEMNGSSYTGYALVLSVVKDMSEEGDLNLNSTADLKLYYTTGASNGRGGNRTLISTIKTGIRNLDSTSFRVNTEIDPNTRAFKVYVDGVLRANVTASEVRGGKSGPQGFGFYTGYYDHICEVLTRINFEEVTVNIVPIQVSATVNFIQQGTGTVIRTPETLMADIIWQKYWIEQPETITYNGDNYYIISNDRGGDPLSKIELTYQLDNAQNVTNIYYLKETELTTQPPSKKARVDMGDWKKGTETDPIPVWEGNQIDYAITAYSPPNGRPMIRQGNDGAATDSTWWGQAGSPAITKQNVRSVTFVNLPTYYNTPAEFLAAFPQWNSKTVLKVWDATEPDTTVNPDFNKAKVFVWAIQNGSSGSYRDIYVGGCGGIWLSGVDAPSRQFMNFSGATAFNSPALLHSDKAVNMQQMFQNTGFGTLDLSKFQTPRVTNMASMFAQCRVSNLNISGFDTSQVTTMEGMFYSTSSLGSLNLSNFNTSNVTNMISMFEECSASSLDLRSFDTYKIPNMDYMFKYCWAGTLLNLTSFDTSNVTSMNQMFYGCGASILDLRNFDTSKVTNMNRMFTECGAQSIDLSSFDTSNITDMSYMFAWCDSLNSINLSSFDTSNVTTMAGMFCGDDYYQTDYQFWTGTPTLNLDLSSFDTSKVTNMQSMFYMFEAATLNLSSFDTTAVTNMGWMFEYSKVKVLDLRNFDAPNVTDVRSMFGSCSATTIDLSGFINTSNIIDASLMFYDCRELTSLDLRGFDTSSVTNMSSMFSYCPKLTSLNLTSFDTSNVTNMSTMFSSCSSLVSLDLGNFDTSNVTNMYGMFYNCPKLTTLNVKSFDTSKVTTMANMLSSCSSLVSLDLSSFNTVNVTTMASMFSSCSSLNASQLNLTNFDTSKVTTMASMFYGCSSFTSVPDLSSFNTSNVTAMSSMFSGCSGLLAVNLSDLDNFDTSKVTTMANMFSECRQVKTIDLRNFNTANVTSMSQMFYRCLQLTSVNLSSFNVAKVTTMYQMFDECTWLPTAGLIGIRNFDTQSLTNTGSMFANCKSLTTLDLRAFNTSKVTVMQSMFFGCTALVSVDLSSFNTAAVTNMESMFSGCSAFPSLNLNNFNTANVTNMSGMFYNCSKLASVNVNTFNTAKVTSMTNMFYNCSSLTSLNVSSFDTARVSNFEKMFYNCNKLTTLDVRNFNTSTAYGRLNDNLVPQYGVVGMFQNCSGLTTLDLGTFIIRGETEYLFSGCSSLTSLDLSGVNTDNAYSFGYMFNGCSSLTSLDLSTFNTVNVWDMYAMFKDCANLTTLDLATFKSDSMVGWYNDDYRTWEFSQLSEMFDGCSKLTSIDLSGFIYTDGLNARCYKHNTFRGTNAALDLKVGSTAVQNMFNSTTLSTGPKPTTITVVSPAGKPVTPHTVYPYTITATAPTAWVQNADAPDDWHLYYTAPVVTQWVITQVPPVATTNFRPPVVVRQSPVVIPHATPTGPPPTSIEDPENLAIIVTDTIPNGLAIQTSSITGIPSATPIQGEITWKISGQIITWNVPESLLPTELLVSAIVNTGQTEGTKYINTATVTGSDGVVNTTNSTYHQFTKKYKVTEQYYLFTTGPTETKLDADLVTMVDPTGSYNIQGNTTMLAGFTYHGYQRIGIDSGIVEGTPPAPAYSDTLHSSGFATTKSENVKLYYKSIMIAVTVHYVDASGNPIKPSEPTIVSPGTDYYMPMYSFDSFSVGGTVYNYFDYAKNPDNSVDGSAIPPLAAVTPGNSPVYPDMSKATFKTVTDSKDITLYFTTQRAVVVHFVEEKNQSNILNNDETYFVSFTFDPASVVRSDGGALTANLDLTSIDGKIYLYANAFKVDGGTQQTGNPGVVPAPCEITLYFETKYVITEKFHDADGNQIDATGCPDNIYANIEAGADFYSLNNSLEEIPNTIGNYEYIGYRIGTDKSELKTGKPSPVFEDVMADATVIYVYEKKVNIIHVRQVVVEPQIGVEVPGTGYIKLNAGTKQLPITVKSGTSLSTDFTPYILLADYGDEVDVIDLIPQYYQLAGYKANSGTAAVEHDQAHMTPGGDISIDFSADGEWWVTVFIKPTTGNPGDYQWGEITNNVGKVLPYAK